MKIIEPNLQTLATARNLLLTPYGLDEDKLLRAIEYQEITPLGTSTPCRTQARIVAATAEQFVPQMVNLELVGGVDFGKGCYPGQEVVARSQYRGTLKRRMFLMHAHEIGRAHV